MIMKLFSSTKTTNITSRCTSKLFVTEYHWRVLVAQGTNGDLFYEKVNFTENFWPPVLKTLESFFDTFLVYELAYPRVQLVNQCIITKIYWNKQTIE